MRQHGFLQAAGLAVTMEQTKTTMRHHQIPEDGTLILTPPEGSKEPAKVVPYSYTDDYLNANVWGRSEWRDDEAWAKAFERLTAAYEGKKARDEVPSTNEDFEKFQKIASMKGLNIGNGGPNVKTITRMAQSVLFATSEPRKIEAPAQDPT